MASDLLILSIAKNYLPKLIYQKFKQTLIMKKSLFLSFFIFTSIFASAQITVSGFGDASINGTWGYIGNTSITYPDGATTDAGADRYSISIANGSPSLSYDMYRRNNFWYIRLILLNGSSTTYNQELYKNEYLSTSTSPPCLGVWAQLYINGGFTSIQPSTLTITGGNCSTQTYTQNVTVNASSIQFPQLNTSDFSGIVPARGMVTFNAAKSSLYLYDGAKWQQLHGSLDDINLIDGKKIILGTASKISSSESILGKLEAKLLTVSSSLTVNSRAAFNDIAAFNASMQLPVTIHTANANLALNQFMQIVILSTSGSTARTFTLPDPTYAKGRIYELQNYTAAADLLIGGYTVQTNGNGGTVSSIAPGTGIRIFSDGTVWRKIN